VVFGLLLLKAAVCELAHILFTVGRKAAKNPKKRHKWLLRRQNRNFTLLALPFTAPSSLWDSLWVVFVPFVLGVLGEITALPKVRAVTVL